MVASVQPVGTLVVAGALVMAGASGYTYKEVAQQLFVSTRTVERHVSAVLRKLRLANRHQLARWAADRRLV